MFAAIEDTAGPGTALGHFSAALGTGYADLHQQRFCIMTLGESGPGLELTEATFTNDHVLAAQFAFFTA